MTDRILLKVKKLETQNKYFQMVKWNYQYNERVTRMLLGTPKIVKKSSWSEHTWSTFIIRAEEEAEPVLLGKLLLSQFQKDKFIHFFYHVLDLNMDHVISQVKLIEN